jgi:hypothetical protein
LGKMRRKRLRFAAKARAFSIGFLPVCTTLDALIDLTLANIIIGV